jgi:hypothetical protein
MKPLGPTTRALISAARPAESPTSADRDRVRARVLAQVAAAGAASAAAIAAKPAAAAGVTGAAAAKPLAAAASSAAAGGIGKAILIGALSAIAAIGALEITGARSHDAAPAATLRAPAPFAAQSAAPATVAPGAESPPPASEESADNGQSAGATGTAESARRAAASAPSAAGPASLRDEITLLQEAQGALAAGDRARALELFEAHRRRFGDGGLRAERLAGRAIALCGAGPSAEAKRAAAELFAANAGSILEARVRAACKGVIAKETSGGAGTD